MKHSSEITLANGRVCRRESDARPARRALRRCKHSAAQQYDGHDQQHDCSLCKKRFHTRRNKQKQSKWTTRMCAVTWCSADARNTVHYVRTFDFFVREINKKTVTKKQKNTTAMADSGFLLRLPPRLASAPPGNSAFAADIRRV